MGVVRAAMQRPRAPTQVTLRLQSHCDAERKIPQPAPPRPAHCNQLTPQPPIATHPVCPAFAPVRWSKGRGREQARVRPGS